MNRKQQRYPVLEQTGYNCQKWVFHTGITTQYRPLSVANILHQQFISNSTVCNQVVLHTINNNATALTGMNTVVLISRLFHWKAGHVE